MSKRFIKIFPYIPILLQSDTLHEERHAGFANISNVSNETFIGARNNWEGKVA
jgi:hypothetical protein